MYLTDPFCTATIGKCPPLWESFDHRKSDNPYLSKFGEAEWENRIRKSPSLRNYVPVSDLIIHMAKCTTEAMEGTDFEGRGFFYHDALSQLTERETREWMKNNRHDDGRTYWSMWLTPVLGCNEMIVSDEGKIVKCYDQRPVGNNPETMCLDNSLIRDVHVRVNQNVGATYFLPDDDERKFSLSTPNRIISAYKRLYCPTEEHSMVPSSTRIIEDVMKVIYAHKCIVKANGNVVRGLAPRKGHRTWVEYKQVNNISEVVVDKDGGDGGDDGDDNERNKNGSWLHHDTKCALQEYWGEADGKQVDTNE